VSKVSVPDVQGMSPQIAKSTLEGAGFNVSVSTRPVSSDQARGVVARTSPGAGTQAEEGSDVTIFISDGNGPNGRGNGNGRRNGNGFQWPFGR
jgi:beta-lactam-binding protein with PASTA domain